MTFNLMAIHRRSSVFTAFLMENSFVCVSNVRGLSNESLKQIFAVGSDRFCQTSANMYEYEEMLFMCRRSSCFSRVFLQNPGKNKLYDNFSVVFYKVKLAWFFSVRK